MEFCPRCGSVIAEKEGKFKCARCSFKPKGKVKIQASELVTQKEKVGVVKEKDVDIMPIINAVCPKCGHREAYFWSSQTRGSDEAETRFFKCTKCKHTWREYR